MKKAGIYIHIPFCKSKCSYCDFYSIPSFDLCSEYINALCNEIRENAEIKKDYEIDSIFFGGGTPCLISEKDFDKIFENLNHFNINQNAEITVECNPGAIEESKITFLKSSGVNRLSFGVQSANKDELKTLGRIHSYEDAIKSVKLAKRHGIDNINCDIIFGLPDSAEDKLLNTVDKITSLDINHISLYALQLEEKTPLFKNKDNYSFPTDDEIQSQYLSAVELLESRGIHQYEISNFSLTGYECKHNIGYWQRKEYFGFGAAAYSFSDSKRYHHPPNIKKYIETCCIIIDEVLSQDDSNAEEIILSLRLKNGISEKRLTKLSPSNNTAILIKKYIENNLMQRTGDTLFLTPRGMFVSNSIINSFLK